MPNVGAGQGGRRTVLAALLIASGPACIPSSWGAAALLHPTRRAVVANPSLPHRDLTVEGEGVTLRGWTFPAGAPVRGVTVVYLHGIADNRASGVWLAERFTRLGFDVVAYDERAHGESTGDACTYGFHERRDLSRVLDAVGAQRVVLVGVSLGAAVALQEAADDPRVVGVVSAAVFSDLETIARERAPWYVTRWDVRHALDHAGRVARFDPRAVSPVAFAARVRVPVLVVHGAADAETRPDHSRRVFAALAGPKQLRIVEGAGHSDALPAAIDKVERWVDGVARSGVSASRALPSAAPP